MVNQKSGLDLLFAALADPTRRAILARLATAEASVTGLARPFRMSLPGVHKHLRVLERAGLVALARRGRERRCRLEGGPLKEAARWIARYRRFWERPFDRPNQFLGTPEVAATPAPKTPTSPLRSPARSRRRGGAPAGPGRRPQT